MFPNILHWCHVAAGSPICKPQLCIRCGHAVVVPYRGRRRRVPLWTVSTSRLHNCIQTRSRNTADAQRRGVYAERQVGGTRNCAPVRAHGGVAVVRSRERAEPPTVVDHRAASFIFACFGVGFRYITTGAGSRLVRRAITSRCARVGTSTRTGVCGRGVAPWGAIAARRRGSLAILEYSG